MLSSRNIGEFDAQILHFSPTPAVLTIAPVTLSLSVVSHGQAALVRTLLNDLQIYGRGISMEVLLTVNVLEEFSESPAQLAFPVKTIRNPIPLGFGENHNRAFRLAEGDFFCVVNPDVRIVSDIFPALLNAVKDVRVGVAAPLVLDSAGQIEDSARFFPTPLKILCKASGRCKGSDYVVGNRCIFPDWVGGMFMLFRREVYRQTGGFDEKFFLYYEDVDLCARVWLLGLRVALIPQVSVIHEARRSSHKKLPYFLHHVQSMLRFFLSPTFWRALYLRKAVRKLSVEQSR